MRFDPIKVSISILLAIALFIIPVQANAADLPASGVSANSFEKAVDLKILGLLANKPDDFELDRAPTRLEGAVMLIRLLGLEHQVQKGTYNHPFTDVPAWADKYIGYAYQNGIAKGISKDSFGSSDLMSASQYATFVLRSMGYKDNVDFSYAKVLDKARELQLLSAAEYSGFKNRAGFLRDDMVALSYNALSVKTKGSDKTLIERLVDSDKAVFKPTAQALGMYPSDYERQYGDIERFDFPSSKNGYVIKNKADLIKVLSKALYEFDTSISIDISGYSGSIEDEFLSSIDMALAAFEDTTGVCDILKQWGYSGDLRKLDIELTYRCSRNEYTARKNKVRAALDKARQIVAENISMNMSDFDKEKILHDYIVNNTEYSYEKYTKGTLTEDDFEEYGSLLSGYAVCEGYAEAMKLLCDLSGIECMIVTGETNGKNGKSEGHAWNIVKIDGEYYHIDVTNDDPIDKAGRSQLLSYCYFNLTDSEMMKLNTWDRTQYPVCSSINSNYFHKYNKIADSAESFSKALTTELDNRSPVIELKVTSGSKSIYSKLSDLKPLFGEKSVSHFSHILNEDIGVIMLFNKEYY